jgi:DNA-binding NarL/FixJ family response regulator
MRPVVLFTMDPILRQRAEDAARRANASLEVVADRAQLHGALGSGARRVLFDLNVCGAGDVLDCVREIKGSATTAQLVVFLDHLVGDLPVRAKLAGADRVVPRTQLEHELDEMLQ